MSETNFFLRPEDEQEFKELILVTLVLLKLFRAPLDFSICFEIVKLTLVEDWTGPGLLIEVSERLRMDYGAVRKRLCKLRPVIKKLLADYYSTENAAGEERRNRPKGGQLWRDVISPG